MYEGMPNGFLLALRNNGASTRLLNVLSREEVTSPEQLAEVVTRQVMHRWPDCGKLTCQEAEDMARKLLPDAVPPAKAQRVVPIAHRTAEEATAILAAIINAFQHEPVNTPWGACIDGRLLDRARAFVKAHPPTIVTRGEPM